MTHWRKKGSNENVFVPIVKPLSFFTIGPFLGVLLLGISLLRAEESVMVLEAYSGKVLIASNSTQKRPIASLTKIATGVVAIDWAKAAGVDIAKHTITVPQTITRVGGPNPMGLRPGDQMSLRDALYSALLGSDNLAAVTIADHVGRQLLSSRGKTGDPVKEFVVEMNRLAKGLGMKHTKFANPHGLDRPGVRAYSTAADVVRLSVYAMSRNAFNFIVRQSSRNVKVSGVDRERAYAIRNSNQLISEEVIGVKTGTTTAAGACISICADRDPLVRKKADGSKGVTPRRLMVVVLNNKDRFERATGLMHRGWAAYDAWLAAGAPVQEPKREIIKVPTSF